MERQVNGSEGQMDECMVWYMDLRLEICRMRK
jgi:hypothetical protein